MLFGLPWFAIIPIVAIIGGLVYAYKEQELKMEEKRMSNSKEVHELRKIIHNLKSRVENLEAIVTTTEDFDEEEADPLSSIELDNDLNEENRNRSGSRRRSQTR